MGLILSRSIELNPRTADTLRLLIQPSGTCPTGAKRLKAVRMWRIENHRLWRRFALRRQSLRRERREQGVTNDDVYFLGREVVGGDGRRGLPPFLDPDVDERYCLHGCRAEMVLHVLHDGLAPVLNGAAGRWIGTGCYVCDDVAQADLFASCDPQDGHLPELHSRLYRNGIEHPGPSLCIRMPFLSRYVHIHR